MHRYSLGELQNRYPINQSSYTFLQETKFMAKQNRQSRNNGNGSVDEEIDALYRLPLHEFTAARHALELRLKKAGLEHRLAKVKSLAKPSIPVWVVNQLYWNPQGSTSETVIGAHSERRAVPVW
jgi:hypothetical protein